MNATAPAGTTPHSIVATDILDCADTVTSIEQLGRRAIGLELDVTDRAAVGTAIDDTVKEFGRLDIVVCSAGIMPPGTMECSTEAVGSGLQDQR